MYSKQENEKGIKEVLQEKKLAYCIPTYNHPEVIEDVIGKVGYLYKQFDIDIYIYDSSENKRTYWVIEDFINQGMDNLHYIAIDSMIGFDEKIIRIFQGYGLKRKYKYLWIAKDRVYLGENTLAMVAKEIKNEYDVIFIGTPLKRTRRSEVKEVYDDSVEFYDLLGGQASSLNTTIFHYEKLLKDIDWIKFRKRYFFNGENLFPHFTVLFHTIGIKNGVNIRLICENEIYESVLGKSMWLKSTFEIWGELWPKVNRALPECYDRYKANVIKETTSLPWILGSVDMLVLLKGKNVLTAEIYELYKNEWENLSNISLEDFRKIACASSEESLNGISTFWDIENRLFMRRDYEGLFSMYCNFLWLRKLDEDGKYTILGDCINMYRIEKEQNVENTIFDTSDSIDNVIQKYVTLKALIKRTEYDVAVEQFKMISEYIVKNHISSTFIVNMAIKHCVNVEEVLNKFVDVISGVDNNG